MEDGQIMHDRSLIVVGAPFSSGQSLNGVAQAPDSLRRDGLHAVIKSVGWKVLDLGNVEIQNDEQTNSNADNILVPDTTTGLKGTYPESAVKNCKHTARACEELYKTLRNPPLRNSLVLTLGGDHSIAVSTLLARLSHFPDIAILWIDAHADCNTPCSSSSGNYHGMPVAHALGLFPQRLPYFDWIRSVPKLPAQQLAYIGLRSVDGEERQLIRNESIVCYTMDDIVANGAAQVVRKAINRIDPQGIRPLHVSWDVDVMDPTEAPGTGTQCRGGLLYREARLIMREIRRTRRLVSLDMVELNPELDRWDIAMHGDAPGIAPNAKKTSRLALQLIHDVLDDDEY